MVYAGACTHRYGRNFSRFDDGESFRQPPQLNEIEVEIHTRPREAGEGSQRRRQQFDDSPLDDRVSRGWWHTTSYGLSERAFGRLIINGGSCDKGGRALTHSVVCPRELVRLEEQGEWDEAPSRNQGPLHALTKGNGMRD